MQTLLAPAQTAPAAVIPRFDMYAGIHKALRLAMADAVARLGAADVDDAADLGQALDALDALLAELKNHVAHENDFLHAAIEARRPGGARRTADDHVGHLDAIANLEDESRALRRAAPERRFALAQRLYGHVAHFVGENLEHMQHEESVNNAALWALYSDAELIEIHDRLLATIGPEEMAYVLRWMAPALTPQELGGMFADMRSKLPPEVFGALLQQAQSVLPPARGAKLVRALDAVPALA